MVTFRCISKQSGVAEKVYVVVKGLPTLAKSRHAGYGAELFLKFGEDKKELLGELLVCRHYTRQTGNFSTLSSTMAVNM